MCLFMDISLYAFRLCYFLGMRFIKALVQQLKLPSSRPPCKHYRIPSMKRKRRRRQTFLP